MCGINGYIKLKKEKDRATGWMRDLVHMMNERVIHRGPDAEGVYADEYCSLGMRRLSVIDLDTGSQPIYNADRSKLIVFNGEIYNYRDLRDDLISEGCIFTTKSDTEVVLLGIEKYGKDFIGRLEGMFSFCIYDIQNGLWLLARDRIGEKPLYYYQTDDFLLFGSELKSLIGTGLVPKEIDREALTVYFQLAYIPAPMCILKGVSKLMAGTVMEVDANGRIRTGQYWKLEVSDDERYQDYEFCKHQLRAALFYSVEQRMAADVPLGAFLSGGFDSSMIVGIMSELSERPVQTFTIGFKEKSYDESELAKAVAKKYGTDHHVVMLDWHQAVKDMDKLLDSIDEPFADASLVASYAVAKMTREYVTVALTGDAGDELFAGYNKYLMGYYSRLYRRVPKPVRKGIIEPAVRHLPTGTSLYRKAGKVVDHAEVPVALQAKRMMSRAFMYEEVKKLIPGAEVSKMNFIMRQFNALSNADDQKRIQFIDFHTVLEGQMLPKVDRASMLASLETRIPMLDTRVIELAFSMPSIFKINKKNRKIILKDACRDLFVDELFHAPKHGFDVPVGIWMDGVLKGRLMKYSSAEYLKKQGLFNREFLHSVIAEKKTLEIGWSTKVWSFFVFQNWYERYIAS